MLQLLGFHTTFGHTALRRTEVPSIPSGHTRYSAMTREYLDRTQNVDISQSRDAVLTSESCVPNAAPEAPLTQTFELRTQSPTDLCIAATQEAIKQAGISAEQIGLVIGDCQTPWQVTPSEGQRVADRLGLKIPAYDIGGGGIAPTQLAALSRWKSSKLPEYALLVTSATPTTRIDRLTDKQAFKEGAKSNDASIRAGYFSDAATAVIVSTKHRGTWSVLDAESTLHTAREFAPNALVIDQFAPLQLNADAFASTVEQLCSDITARAIFKHKLHGSHLSLALGEANEGMAKRVAEGHSIHRWGSTFEQAGYCFGSTSFVGFADLAQGSRTGDRVIMTQALPGYQVGFVVFEKN